jgi:hypothetical protein
MLRKFLYIIVVCAAQTFLASYGVAYASHGHDFPENTYNPCDFLPCEDVGTDESTDESAEENTEENTDESAEESTDNP